MADNLGPEHEIGADAVAHFREALKAMQDPKCVRTLFASVIALALREVPPARRMGVGASFVSDALRLVDQEEVGRG